MSIKRFIPKILIHKKNLTTHFVVDDDVSLCNDNIIIDDISFNPSLIEEEDRGYYGENEWVVVYLKDLNDYLCIEFTIDYSFDLKIDEGDYWTPPYTEIINREVLVGVDNIRLEENEYNFSNEFYGVVECFIEDYVKSYF
jgi:hypothetical protein